MDFLNILLAPFLYIIKQFFDIGYDVTGNYGFSIILLSFFISLILLPVFILIEKAKKKNDAIKAAMKPLYDEIKRCYKGQERYYYLKTLNRQYAYSQTQALIPILSLLLQIPFFIAAYQFLETYKPLQETSFLFIRDLSLPDGVFGIVNILPIVMTLVNLLTAYFYTRNGNTNERRQMVIVAGVFLILLFKLPSGLVLYWTMNNVFSFFRLFITNPEVFSKHRETKQFVPNKRKHFKEKIAKIYPTLKPVFHSFIFVGCLSQLYWAYNNNFNDILVRLAMVVIASFTFLSIAGLVIILFQEKKKYLDNIRIEPRTFCLLSIFAIYFYLGGIFYYETVNETLIHLSLLFLIPLQILGLIYYSRAIKQLNAFFTFLISSAIAATLIVQILNFVVFVSNQSINISVFNADFNLSGSTLTNVASSGVGFLLVMLLVYFGVEQIDLLKYKKSAWIIYALSNLYLLGFILLWNPLSVFSTFPASFNFFALDILKNNASIFFVVFLVLIGFYFVLPRKFKTGLVVLLLTLVVLSFIHNTIIPIELGSLHEGHFTNPENLAIKFYWYILEGLLIAGIFMGCSFLIRRNYQKQISIVLGFLILVTVIQSFYNALQSTKFKFNPEEVFVTENSLSFSKTEQNVIFLIPDAFQGCNLYRMMEENMDMIEQFKGFVWYPNTLAISRVTNTSIAPLVGGYDYTPDKLHKDKSRTNHDKITQAKKELSERVRKHNYLFTSNKLPYAKLGEEYYDTFLPPWHEDWDLFYDYLGVDVALEEGYTTLWNNALLFSSPLIFKSRIYNEGNWFRTYSGSSNKITWEYMKYHFFRLLPKISNTNSPKGNFMLIYSMVTHAPCHKVNDDGTITRDVSPYQNSLWLMHQLAEWIEWMKENDVYDNTKIVIVSDHGGHWKHYKGDIDIDIPFKNINEDIVSIENLLDLNPLLLVKDFNSEEPFSLDMRFLSNVDAPAIAFGENDPTKPDSLENRTLSAFTSWWSKDMEYRHDFYLVNEYEVTTNIFDVNNWVLKKKYYK